MKNNFEYQSTTPIDLIKANPKPIIYGLISLTVLILGLTMLAQWLNPAKDLKTPSNISQIIRPHNIRYGNKDSKIKVILFEDPQCPGCQSFTKGNPQSGIEGFSELKQKYSEKIEVIYKVAKIIPNHAFSAEASKVALAVNKESGRGEEFLDKMYVSTPEVSKLNREDMVRILTDMSLDVQKITQISGTDEIIKNYEQDLLDSKIIMPKVEGYTNKDIEAVSGTPTIIVLVDQKVTKFTIGGSELQSALVTPEKALTSNPASVDQYLAELTQAI